jgi:hypothetical protein
MPPKFLQDGDLDFLDLERSMFHGGLRHLGQGKLLQNDDGSSGITFSFDAAIEVKRGEDAG